MKKTDYYAIVNYRGKQKIYYVSAEQENDIRAEWVDYKPERQSEGFWIFGGKKKIIKKFTSRTKEYKYYKALKEEWNKQIQLIREYHEKVFTYVSIGTDNYKRAYKTALKLVPNPLE